MTNQTILYQRPSAFARGDFKKTMNVCKKCGAALDPGERCDCTFASVDAFVSAIENAQSPEHLNRAILEAENRQRVISYRLGDRDAEREWLELEDLMPSALECLRRLEEGRCNA